MAPMTIDEAGDAATVKPPSDVVIPPKDIRRILEKSAGFVARRGESYETRIAEKVKEDSRLQFLQPDNVYNSYYIWRKKEIAEGRGYADEDGAVPAAAAKKTRKGPDAPAEFEFSARMPTISAVDLEVVKLTALFVAVKGSSWMTKFSQVYGQQSQFSFLRPQHSFHQFFTRLVDQYRELLLADSGELAMRQSRRVEELEHNIADKYHILDRAKARAEWVKYQEAQKVKEEEQTEAEKISYAQIDWHDFTVVGTIQFEEDDESTELPPPTNLLDLQSASLEQKANFGAPPDRRLEEAMPFDDAFFQTPNQQPPPPTASPIPPPPPPQAAPSPYAPTPPQTTPFPAPYVPVQAASSPDPGRLADRQAEADRAAAARAAAAGTGPMRIRENYVPRAQARRAQTAQTAVCPICQQSIPVDEYEKHVRIEQLDPRWREQTRIAQQRSATTNLSTADVANNLKRLASQRSDVFDPVTGRQVEEREAKRVEVGQGQPAPGMIGAQMAGNRSTDVQEQLRMLQNKYGQQG